MDPINCPVCGEENPAELEKCQHCNQSLRQSTSELNGVGKLIDSGHTPTAKDTTDLENTLPAWLKNARQGADKEEAPEEPPPPPPVEPEPEIEPEAEKVGDAAPLDWLAGLDSDDEEDDEEAADWLLNLQGDLAPEEEEDVPEGIPATDEPITAGDAPRPAEEEAPPIKTGELPDWVSDLQGDEKKDDVEALPDLFADEEKQELRDADDGELPDWLSTLSKEKDSEIEPSIETPLVQPVSTQETDANSLENDAGESLPDWMSDLQRSAETEISSVEDSSPITSDEDLPDWITSGNGAPAAPIAEEEIVEETSLDSSDDLPDWMGDLSATEEVEEEAEEALISTGSLPDWLSTDAAPPAVEEKPIAEETPLDTGGDLPDWMNDLQASGESEVDSVEDSSPISSDDDLPDRLSGDGVSSAPSVEEEKEETVEETSLDSGDFPDWMGDLQTSSGTEASSVETDLSPAVAAAEEEASISTGNLPDWMSDLQTSGERESDALSDAGEEQDVAEDSAISSGEDEDAPSWVGVLTSADDKVAEDTDGSVSDDEPEWLSALPVDDFSAQSVENTAEAEASSQAFEPSDESTTGVEDADIPDWLSKMGEPATGPLDEAKLEVPLAEEGKPGWLEDLPVDDKEEIESTPSVAAFLAAETADDAEDDIFGIETPDWLSSLGPEDIDDEFPVAETEETEESTSSAELPSWVQAMRPVADVVADSSKTSDEQLVAESGPLAGLSGILPVNPGLGPLSKPRAHSIKLQVGESQQSSAAILEELLAKESQPRPFETPEKTSSIPLLRWLIAVLLFLGVASSLLSKTEMVASPKLTAPEVQEAFNVVNSIPAGGSALVVFDYEAAFSAEMKTVAAPLVSQLMSRSEMLITLSTSPMGPALAENFLSETQRLYEFEAGVNYIDLGYLPGDASAMLGFVTAPKAMVSKKIDDISVWDLPPLQNITNFSDFSVILVLTNDVEKGRNWVEQSTLALVDSNTPLLMAVSAQAEPIIYPYYDSGQVDGLVSGLSGGVTYEQMQKKENGLARKYWDSYSVGLFLAEILIAVGAMINLLAALKSGQRSKEEK